MESKMKKLIATIIIVSLAGLFAANARGGMHGGGTGGLMHSAGTTGLGSPANPSVPPSLTPDSRLTGNAPLPPHHQPTRSDVASGTSYQVDPEDAKVDRMIGNICRGC
jgi:hypothetical protein